MNHTQKYKKPINTSTELNHSKEKPLIRNIKGLTSSNFARNVAIAATGTAGAQAVNMLFAPITTRIYGPETFGLLGIFMALVEILAPAAALTYPTAIVIANSDADAKGIARLSARIALFTTTLIAAILLSAGNSIAAFLNIKEISEFLPLLPLAIILVAIYQIIEQWLVRNKEFKATARAAIFQSLALNSARVGAGLLHPAPIVLIIINTLGSGLHAFLLWAGTKNKLSTNKINPQEVESEKKHHEKPSLRSLASQHRDFPIFRAPQVLINALSNSIPILMIAAFFGPAAAGFYTLGKTIMGIPSTLIGKSVGDVFYPRITEAAKNKENLFKLLSKSTLALAAAGIIPFSFMIAFAPWLFSFAFGSNWEMAGEYTRWLALWMFFGFINKPSAVAIITLGMQKSLLIYEVASMIVKTSSLYLGFLFFESDLIAISIFSISGALLNLFLIFITIKKSKTQIQNPNQ